MKEYKYIINGKDYKVVIGDITDNVADVTVNGEQFSVEMEPEPQPEKKTVVLGQAVKGDGQPDSSLTTSNANINVANAVKAPLPGVITSIEVTVGQHVSAGETLLVLEAMKMANNIEAENNGTVTAILVKQGENVMEDTPLIIIE